MHRVDVEVTPGFSLAETVAPVGWGGGRWPNQDWLDGDLVAVSANIQGTVSRHVRQREEFLEIASNVADARHQQWADDVLGAKRIPPKIDDPVIARIAARFPGMRPYSNGNLFEGIITAIVGQSISVQAAAVTERKLAALFTPPLIIGARQYWPTPTAEQLANADPALVRTSGVTQRRADAIVAIARLAVAAQLLPTVTPAADPGTVIEALMQLPLVGRWTAESVLLWGLGADDAYPAGDVALLRAARLAYDKPEMSHAEMDVLADGWRPGRSWAARWLWLNLFGPAPKMRPT